MKKEIVICAAIKTPNGIVIPGHRHGDCFRSFKAEKLRKDGVRVAISEQGFITSRNRFVSRKEAKQIQDAAGIKSIDPEGYRYKDSMFSEDLY
jgi:hypothetical protein